MKRERTSSSLGPEDFGTKVTVGGWIQDIRNLGGIAFVQLRDRDGVLQVTTIKKQDKELFKLLTKLPRESVVTVRGEVVENQQARMGFEVLAEAMEIGSEAATPLPLGVIDMVDADMDTRLDNRFMDLRKEEVLSIFRLRAAMLASIRDYLAGEGFIEVHTPKIVAAATEGGTDLFTVKYFDREAYLNQSPQLFKQYLMSAGFERIYEVGPAFRAEPHDTSKHLNEYTSIDIEMSFADEEDAMDILEGTVKAAVRDSLEAIQHFNPELKGGDDLEKPFPRITYDEAVELVRSNGSKMEHGEDFSAEEEAILGEQYPGFYFITRWPTAIKPFYALPFDDRPEECRAFDLMYGSKEITSGAQRVHQLELLRSRLIEQDLVPEDFGFYLDAFTYGIPPHAGWGLGAERLLMIMTAQTNIRECILFPRDMKRLVP